MSLTARTLKFGVLSAFLVSSSLAVGASLTRTSAFEYNAQGLLVKEIIEPDNSALCVVTTHSYDAYGNKVSSTTRNCNGSAGSHPGINSEASAPAAGSDAIFAPRTVSSTYDANGQFPVTLSNALGQSETRAFDPRFGTMTQLTGPNGLSTTWAYDGFGRKIRETRADGTESTWAYELCNGTCAPQYAAYKVTATSTGAPNTITYYDALDRVVRNETQGFDGAAIYQDTVYDALGRVEKTSRPYYANETPLWTRVEYDAMNRVVRTIAPDNTDSTVTYNGLRTVTTNAQGQTRTLIKNSRGELIQSLDADGNALTYTYDAYGNLLSTTDAQGNVSTLSYDARGRKVAMDDPDMGQWSYRYNAMGELVGQTDALGHSSTITYDVLGRMTQRTETDLISRWHYDTDALGAACGKSVGKLCEATADNGYRRVHHYDTLGRPDTGTTTLDTAYTASVTYDNVGRVSTRTWPTGYSIRYDYTALGYLNEVHQNDSSNQLLWRADSLDAQGRLKSLTYGNAVVTTYSYDPLTNRLAAIQAGAGNTEVQNLAYGYDSIGNLTSRQDNNNSTLEGFGYDNLNRLTDYTLQGGALSTIEAYSVSYDSIGNIQNKSDVGAYAYNPSGAGTVQPHALLHVTGGARHHAHTYDANGNLIYTVTSDPGGANGVVRTETYTSFNKPQQISQGPSGGGTDVTLDFTYGPEHQRTKQISSTHGTTYYLNGTDGITLGYEKLVRSGQPTEHRHYINAGGEMIAMHVTRTDATVDMRYFHHDRLGSATAITNALGQVVERLAYDPWGKRRAADGNVLPAGFAPTTTDRGFTMHEHLDEMDIIHMNGRVFDPTLARFMSADPFVEAPTDLRSFNRYSYVWNNPLAAADPSGYCFLGCAWKKVHKSGTAHGLATIKHSIWSSPQNLFKMAQSVPGQSAIDRFVASNPTAYAIGNVVATVVGSYFCGPCGGAAYSSYYSYYTTGSVTEAAKAGAIAYATSAAFNYVGANTVAGSWQSYAGHAAVGCASAAASGGNCGTGAVSQIVSKFATVNGPDWVQKPDGGFAQILGGAAFNAVVGGTVSVIGGGKFANGAQTAAYGYMFNHLGAVIRSFQYLSYRLAPYADKAATVGEALVLAATGTPSPTSFLMPGGEMVGWAAKGANVMSRTVFKSEFDMIVGNLMNQSVQVGKAGYPGQWFRLADDAGEWGLRMSKSHGLTLTLRVPGVTYNKIHYVPSKVDLIPK